MLKRITKRQARKRFEAGEDIILLPCGLNPNNPYENKFSRIVNNRKLHNIVYFEKYKGWEGRIEYVSKDDFDGIVRAYQYEFCEQKKGVFPLLDEILPLRKGRGRHVAYYIGKPTRFLNEKTYSVIEIPEKIHIPEI